MGLIGLFINPVIFWVNWTFLNRYYDPTPFLFPWFGFIVAGDCKWIYDKK